MRLALARRAAFCAILVLSGSVPAQDTKLTRQQMEEFLRTAKVLSQKRVPIGVTGSLRAQLSDGVLTHAAHIQSIDEAKQTYQTDRGTEINFRDSWKFNVAAYRIDKLLDLNMIPVSVERKLPGFGKVALTWWVDDVLMDEVTRHKTKIQPPDQLSWNRQMYMVRVFDQLIYNTDRNLQNLLMTKDWRIWMIDHTRGFRTHKELKQKENLVQCDRRLLDALRRLDAPSLMREVKEYLTPTEIRGLLARRDLIVKFFEEQVARKGEQAVLYDLALR